MNKSSIVAFVATRDAQRSRAFYERSLGLRFVSSDDFALVFDVNGTMLRIQKVKDFKPQGFTVLGWKVADIRKVMALLVKQGVAFTRYEGMVQDKEGIWTAPGGAKIAWFSDPDGNILSLTEF